MTLTSEVKFTTIIFNQTTITSHHIITVDYFSSRATSIIHGFVQNTACSNNQSENNILHSRAKSPEIMEKPKRPLSAYNYFFQHERKQLLGPDFFVDEKEGSSDLKRRVHRKKHGKYSFGEMARVIAKKWKDLDEDARFEFEDLAAEDKHRYKQQMKIWKKSSKQEQQQYKRETEELQQHQEQLWKQASITESNATETNTNKNESKLNTNNDTFQTVIAENPLPSRSSAVSAQLKSSPDDGEKESEIKTLHKLILSGRNFVHSDHCRQESVSESSETTLRRLLLQNRNAPHPEARIDSVLNRHAVATAAAPGDAVAALSSLSDPNAILRTLAEGGDSSRTAAALNAINARRIHEENVRQANMKELLRRQMLELESQGGANELERALRRTALDPLVPFRSDRFSRDSWQCSRTNVNGLEPSDVLALITAARLRASTEPLSHHLLGSLAPVTETNDSKLSGFLRDSEK